MTSQLNIPKVLLSGKQSLYGDDFTRDCIWTDPEAMASLGKAGHLDKSLTYLEPACGLGNLARPLVDRGYECYSSDIMDWGYGLVADFFHHQENSYDVVITNPPYSMWAEFIRTGLEVARKDLFLLLPTRYLEGERRSRILKSTGLSTVLVFTYRLKMYASDGKKLSGFTSYSWYHWSIGNNTNPPIIKWLGR